MIPGLNEEGLLPEGIHDTTLDEVRRRFGAEGVARPRLMKGLQAVAALARKIGARELYLDGSFVTDKKEPADWDAVLVAPVGTNCASREVLRLVDRAAVKKHYGGDLFLIMEDDGELMDHYLKGVFVRDRRGTAKGILRLSLLGKEKRHGAD